MRGCMASCADSLVFERVSGASVTVDGSSSEHDKWLWVERMQLPTDVAVHACCAGSLDVTYSWECDTATGTNCCDAVQMYLSRWAVGSVVEAEVAVYTDEGCGDCTDCVYQGRCFPYENGFTPELCANAPGAFDCTPQLGMYMLRLLYLPIFACLAKGGNCINAQPTEPPQADCTMMPFNTDACANTNGNIVTQHVCTSVAGNLGMDYDADGSNVIENCNDSSILTMHNGDDGCDWYVGRRSSCGDHDDADFDPEADCCTCTGGLNAPILTPAPSSPSSEGEPRMSQRVK